MKTTAKITAVLLVLALVGSTSAKVITVKVEGVVDSVTTNGGLALDGSVGLGSTMTGYCTYNTDTPELGRGSYALISISMTIGNYTFTHDPASHALFRVGYDGGPFYRTMSYSPRFDGMVYINGSPKTYEDITWHSTYLLLFELGTLSSISPRTYALPTSFPDISLFDWVRGFRTYFTSDNGSSFQIYGEITSLTVVPAPFEVTPASVDFHYYLGGPNPEPQTLYVWAKGVDTLNWQITEDCNWLDVSPPSGQSSGEVDEVTLTVDISGLAPGSYHCQLTIFDPNVSEDYILHLPVNLFIGTKLFVPSQYLTIQAAIDAADDYDMVLVADGTYTGPGNRDIDFLGKPITVRSESGPENCIIDCNGTISNPHRGFRFHNYEDEKSVVTGFKITNGYAREGGGIYCDDSSPTITNCTITNNSAWWNGGGISCERSSAVITNCTISGNTAKGDTGGGGIYCDYGSITITNCNISGNTAKGIEWGGDGGGIRCIYSSPTINNCTITGNMAGEDGGGIDCQWYSSPTITNCTISGNSAGYGGGGIKCWENSSTTIENCILWANEAPDGPQIYLEDNTNTWVRYTDVQGGQNDVYLGSDCTLNWGSGNINLDPCFVEPGYWADANDPNIAVEPNDPNAVWIKGDYYLLPDSLCIDAGDPNYIPEPGETDLDGNPRVIDGRIDMGAYESNYIQAAMQFTPQTLNCNSKGNWVKAHFVLPEGFLPEDVDVNEPAMAEPMGAESEYIRVFGNDDGPVKLEIAFDREAFCAQITETGEVEITVIGSLTTGRYFYATDTIRIKL